MRYLVFAIILFAAPLSAQQTVVVPNVNVEVENVIDSIRLNLTVTMPEPDSAQIAREEEGLRLTQALADYMENCGCIDRGSSNVSVVANAGLTLAAFFIGWQLKRIADKPNGDTNVDTNIDVHEHKHDHDNESGEGNK